MKRTALVTGVAALLLGTAGAVLPVGVAQAVPYDCERSGKGAATLELLRTVQWTERNGMWWGVGSDGVTEVSNVAPWLRGRFGNGRSNADGSYTTYEYASNYQCP